MLSFSFVLIVSSLAVVAATLIAGIVLARGEDQIRARLDERTPPAGNGDVNDRR
jgi:hypothetical protein